MSKGDVTTGKRCSVFAHLAQEGHKSSGHDDKCGVMGLVSNALECTSTVEIQL